MSDTVIKVENISKLYRLGEVGTGTLRHDLNRWWHLVRGKEDPYRMVGETNDRAVKGDSDYVWALKDVSFEVNRGEVLGIVGRNGAGKSTLLKILSRVTLPTAGEIKARGRIVSLLEVGTGFHPELTGRDNIYLNGAILGMRRREIDRKFDEIAAFAEVDRYIDTPVKRYSSGMYVRLAFAVAAHLEPEILIVDEVLAVGDAQFQKKCLGKMKDVSTNQGRTVLFVSHNMAAVRTLCPRGLLMQDGHLLKTGDISTVVGDYLRSSLSKASSHEWPDPGCAPGNEHLKMTLIRVRPPDGELVLTVDTGALIEIVFYNARKNINLDCTIFVLNSDGVVVFESECAVSTENDSQVGFYSAVGTIPPHFLNTGRYGVNLIFGKDQRYVLFGMEDVLSFELANTNTGRGRNMYSAVGVVRPMLKWSCEFNPERSTALAALQKAELSP